MKKNLALILLTVLFLLPVAKTFAQETIMNDIDYPFMQKLVNEAKQNYIPVKVKQEQVNVARIAYKETKIAWFDALSFNYVYSPTNTINLGSNANVNSVTSPTGVTTTTTQSNVNPNLFQGYQAAMTLNLGNLIRNPYHTKSARSSYNIALLEQQDYNNVLESQVRRLYITYVQAMTTVRMRTQNAQDVRTLLTQAKDKFENHTLDFTAYSSATTAFAAANQAKIDAEAAVIIAKLALEEVVGKRLEDIK
jgi:outer membrane protein TolC